MNSHQFYSEFYWNLFFILRKIYLNYFYFENLCKVLLVFYSRYSTEPELYPMTTILLKIL